jgi:hypothetical protein
VWRAKILRKRDLNGKDPPRASTKEMTVKLERKGFGCLTGTDTEVSFGQSLSCEMSSRPIKKGSPALRVTQRRGFRTYHYLQNYKKGEKQVVYFGRQNSIWRFYFPMGKVGSSFFCKIRFGHSLAHRFVWPIQISNRNLSECAKKEKKRLEIRRKTQKPTSKEPDVSFANSDI